MIRKVVWVVCASAPAFADLRGPAPETKNLDVHVELPAVPAFDLAAGELGAHRLRIDHSAFLGKRVVIHGFVTFAYDCVVDLHKPGETVASVRKRIEDDPTLCERPRFYIADSRTTSPEHSLWVVDVPRPYNKLELANIDKADRTRPDRCEPGEKDPAKQVCPPYKAGDEVIVVGTFQLASPHSDRNSDGLLVYEAAKNITRKWQTSGATFEPTLAPPSVAAEALPELRAIARPPSRPVATQIRDDSVEHLNAGNKQLAANNFDDARAEYQKAVAVWPDDVLAWYGLGLTELKASNYGAAVDALAHAVAIAPDDAMYQMYFGVALYDDAVTAANETQARALGRKPDEVQVELSQVNFGKAQEALRRAVWVEPHLWRAHYHLGKIFVAQGRARDAANEFTLAISSDPVKSAPYVALAKLYLQWDYADQAIQVAKQGTTLVAKPEVSDVFYELGMGYDDKGLRDKAITAFTGALDAKPTSYQAMFQRGQDYFALGRAAKAKADLEEFVKNAGATQEFAKQQASKMLMDLAAKQH